MSSLVTSYFHFHATACFILVHVHYLWYAYFFIVHYAWLTLRGHWTLGFYYIIVAMSLLQTVNFMFPFNSCISPDFYCVITWPLGMLPLSKILLLWHDSIWILSSLDLIGQLLNIIILSCYHSIPSMIHLACDYLLYGNLTYYHVPWSVTYIPALHAMTGLHSTYVLLIPDHVYFMFFP